MFDNQTKFKLIRLILFRFAERTKVKSVRFPSEKYNTYHFMVIGTSGIINTKIIELQHVQRT